MNLLDVGCVVLVALAAAGGWRAGLVARIGGWLGLGLGVLVGLSSLGPLLELLGAAPQDAFVVALGVLSFAALAGEVLGGVLGSQLSVHVPDELRSADRAAGGVAGALSVLLLLWLLSPVMAASSGWPERLADGSSVMRWTQRSLPAAPDAVAAVEVLLGADRYPAVFDREVAPPDVGDPPSEVTLAPGVGATIELATARVQGEACGRRQQGSGVVLGDGIVVTNAHVVSGVEGGRVEVELRGVARAGTVVGWDPAADLAVLSVPGVRSAGLVLADAREGDLVAVAGYPGGGGLTVLPGRVGEVVRAGGRDIYGERRVVRDVLVLAASVERGSSGGPAVRSDGALVGIVFALAPDDEGVGFALTPDAVRSALADAGTSAVSTGACIEG